MIAKTVLKTLFILVFCCQYLKAQITVYKDSVRKISLSGYIQAQYEKADSTGVPTYDGGDFAKNVDSRFMLRRTRFAVDYSQGGFSGNFEVDYILNNVRVTNAYVQYTDQKWNAFTAGLGLTTIPFGLETQYSSFNLESSERSRMIQTLFPDEKDAGVQLVFNLSKSKKWKFIRINLAYLNGSGRNFADYDSKKNFVSALKLDLADQIKSNVFPELEIGFSHYYGGSRSNTNTILYEGTVNGVKGFFENTSDSNLGGYVNRIYTGFDFLSVVKTPIGFSKVMFEYIAGEQPGVASSSTINGPRGSRSFNEQPTTNLYARTFYGYFVTLDQSVGNSDWHFVLKYDWYDPNTYIKLTEIGATNSNTTSADIAYGTWLFGGYLNLMQGNARVALYYDIIRNEKTLVSNYRGDIKDNILTARVQFKF